MNRGRVGFLLKFPATMYLQNQLKAFKRYKGGLRITGKIRARRFVVIFRPVVHISRMGRAGSGDIVSGLTWSQGTKNSLAEGDQSS